MGSIQPQSSQTILLDRNWQFREASATDAPWLPAEKVPSTVHVDLMQNGLIPDPFVGRNELAVEWVGERDWAYQVSFDTPDYRSNEEVDIVFEGLDTISEVFLNSSCILKTGNMFIKHRVSIRDFLRHDRKNVLEIVFKSALQKGRDLEKEHAGHKFIALNGEAGRLAVRKAQYNWGWDWGPVLMTAGPWRPVTLEVYQAKAKDVWVDYTLSENLLSVTGTIHAETTGCSHSVRFKVAQDDNVLVAAEGLANGQGFSHLEFKLANPKLWFPFGYGDQTMYQISAEVIVDGHVTDSIEKRFGFRQIELIRQPDSVGESFYFRVNGIDIFAGGSCWIPADSLLTRVAQKDYREWLALVRNGNQNMIRVWGGGIYEDDLFYDVCDELGILVWQDFMFACGNYPTYTSFIKSINEEARYNCRRLRHHPSIGLYCGSNEDYQILEWFGLEYQDSKDPEEWLKSSFPARYIYEHLLPKIVQETCAEVAYWPCSPFTSPGKNSGDITTGDVHMWDVWHNKQEKYQRYPEIGGRFNSEFGIASLPSLKTIRTFVDDEREMYGQSLTMDFHNKADGQERRIATYVLENFRQTSDFETWIYLTQLTQSEAMLYAYRDWRRQWGHPRRCGGALAWQLNDCWPCSSWAVVDYFRRPKPAYYAIKRCLEPIAVGIRREHQDWSNAHARPKASQFSTWVSSSLQTQFEADLEIRFISIASGEDIKTSVWKLGVEVGANGTTEVLADMLQPSTSISTVLAVRLWRDGVCIARDYDWPQPYKYLHLDDRGLTLSLQGDQLSLETRRPVKGFVLEEQEGVVLSDNGIDIMPRDSQVIVLSGFQGSLQQLKWRCLD